MTRRQIIGFAIFNGVCSATLVRASAQPQKSARARAPRIALSKLPPVGPGSDTETYVIAGSVSMTNPGKFKIVVYTHTNLWYVQPTEDTPLTDIGPDGSWNTTVHPGDQYSVLVVDPDYSPPTKKPSLPAVGGKVLAQKLLP